MKKDDFIMFEEASRNKFRFEAPNGFLTVEDLWDLPLTSRTTDRPNLDDIARTLHKQLRSGDNISFVIKEQKSDPTVQLKFDLVRHVIEVRLAERDAAAKAEENRAKKQRILEIIAGREDEALKSLSMDDLKKMISELS
jgi:hypothetical protein